MNLSILDILYKWSHTIYVSLWLFSPSILFSRFAHIVAVLFDSFYGWILFHYMYIPHFVYPFISWWTFGFFPFFLAIMNNAIIYTHVLIQEFVWTCVLICLGFLFYLRIEWLGHMVTVCLTIQRLTELLSSAAALLHSYQHSMKVLICSYSHQHML